MPPTERVFVAQPLALGGRRVIVAPFQFQTSGDDNLRVVSFNSAAGVRLAIQGLRVDEHGNGHALRHTHTPNTDRSASVQNYALGPGALQSLTVFAEAGAPLVGQTYVMVQLIRGLTGATIVLGTLLAGYVTARQALGWPGSPIQSSTSGEPHVRVFTGTNPAAGSEILETVPTGARWELLSTRFGLTTSAVAGNRRVTMFGRLSGAVLFQVLAFNVQAASVTHAYTFGPDVEGTSDLNANIIQSGTPSRVILLAGTELGTAVNGMDAGDDLTAPAIAVREWLEAEG